MKCVRLTCDAAWYPGSLSVMLHTRVVGLDTLEPSLPIVELHDRRYEILENGGDPPVLVKTAIHEALREWGRAIARSDPF